MFTANARAGEFIERLPVVSEPESSEAEPAVLSYTEFRNRECLLAWRQRYREHEAVSSPAALSAREF